MTAFVKIPNAKPGWKYYVWTGSERHKWWAWNPEHQEGWWVTSLGKLHRSGLRPFNWNPEEEVYAVDPDLYLDDDL